MEDIVMGSQTRGQMRSEVIRKLGETAGYITTDDVNEWLKESYIDFADRTESLVDFKTLPIMDGVANLPPGYRDIISVDTGTSYYPVEYQLGTGIIAFRPYDKAPPEINVRIVSTPSSDSGAAFLQLDDDAKKTSLPNHCDRALVLFAVGRAFQKDDRETEAQTVLREYYSIVQSELLRTVPLRRKAIVRSNAWTGRVGTGGSVFFIRAAAG